jgi:putative methyltransferase (TIGR04325 family)
MAVTAMPARFPRSARRLARSVARGAAKIPWLERVAGAAYARYFNAADGAQVRLFRGIYPDFATAAREIPSNRLAGYDNAESAQRVIGEWLTIYPYDYPIMFWLEKLLPECRLLLDWGGNVGLKYFAYRKYLTYPAGMRWSVCEVPAVAEAGRVVAEREGARDLSFTTTFEDLPLADILLAAGALHFIDDPFGIMREAAALPKHLLLCKVPVYDRPTAVTLQNMGTSICTYRLYNRDEFVANVEALGYRLVDEWRTPDGSSCIIPFYPEHAIEAYSGFYFERTA